MEENPGHAQQAAFVWKRPGIGVKLAYGVPFFAFGAMGAPLVLELKIFYTDTLLVPAGLLALAIACARAFDALTDPVMGWISDQTRTRWGRRKPWLPLGALLCALFYWLMFTPPQSLSVNNGLLLWAGMTYCLFYIFLTIWNVPYQGLGLELSPDYNDRIRLFGIRAILGFLGLAGAFFLIAGIKARGVFADERQMISMVTGVLALMLIVSFIIPLLKVRENPEFSKQKRTPLTPGVRRALRNRPFRIVMFAYILSSVPLYMPPLIMPYFSKYVLVLDDKWRAIFAGIYTLAGFLSIPLWMLLGKYIGKRRIWMISSIIGILSGLLIFTAGEGQITKMILLEILRGMTMGAMFILIPAILADVVDYDELQAGKRREAQFTSFASIVPKFVSILSAALPLAVMGVAGYNPGMTSLSSGAVLTIRILFALVPTMFCVVVLIIIRRYPISRQVHRTIRNSINDRQQGREAHDPITGETLLATGEQVVDEETGWFLDTFSRHELRQLVTDGPGGLLRRILIQVTGGAIVCLGAIGATVWLIQGSLSISQTDQLRQGLATCMVIVAGLALTFTLFHLMRVGPARKMTSMPVDGAIIRNHIDQL
jgi:GPH family glycoside/pentoside/hexuronide:cation symporter